MEPQLDAANGVVCKAKHIADWKIVLSTFRHQLLTLYYDLTWPGHREARDAVVAVAQQLDAQAVAVLKGEDTIRFENTVAHADPFPI